MTIYLVLSPLDVCLAHQLAELARATHAAKAKATKRADDLDPVLTPHKER